MELSTDELNSMRLKIEAMNKFNHVEILKILKKYKSVTLNENKYGTHINLTEVEPFILEEVKGYINYVGTQETNLSKIEKQKEQFKNTYFNLTQKKHK